MEKIGCKSIFPTDKVLEHKKDKKDNEIKEEEEKDKKN